MTTEECGIQASLPPVSDPFCNIPSRLTCFMRASQRHDNYFHTSEDRSSGSTVTRWKVVQRSLRATNFPPPWSAPKIQPHCRRACALLWPSEGVGTTATEHYSTAPSSGCFYSSRPLNTTDSFTDTPRLSQSTSSTSGVQHAAQC